jgi:hypothetical protein
VSIPKRLIRTVPTETTAEVEVWWDRATRLHPDWDCVTLRDPVDRSLFPISAPYWDDCESGAQLADLIRLEELLHRGGVYIDSDVEVYRPFDPLLLLSGFAGWDCVDYVPNAIMGFEARHPALPQALGRAIARQHQGTWAAGVGVTTQVFRDRDDMVLFPPGAFYPVFWRLKNNVDWSRVQLDNPWAYCVHRAAHSWKDAGK